MSSKIVIFGGSGFLGSTVADTFTDAGHKVVIFDERDSEYLKDNQKMVVGSINDRELVFDTVQDADYVLSFAAIADISEGNKDPQNTMMVNVMGTMNILDACVKHGVKKFIFSSTIYVYGDKGGFYRVSKQACEKIIEEYHSEFGLKYTILRFGSLYGPRANHFNSIKKFIRQALAEGRITRKSDGGEVRSYIYIIDAAKLVLKTIESKYDQEHVVITGNEKMKISDILETIAEIFGNRINIEYVDGEIKGHYKLGPHSYKPKVALKMVPEEYHDFGQGLIEVIHEVESENHTSSHNEETMVSVKESLEL